MSARPRTARRAIPLEAPCEAPCMSRRAFRCRAWPADAAPLCGTLLLPPEEDLLRSVGHVARRVGEGDGQRGAQLAYLPQSLAALLGRLDHDQVAPRRRD